MHKESITEKFKSHDLTNKLCVRVRNKYIWDDELVHKQKGCLTEFIKTINRKDCKMKRLEERIMKNKMMEINTKG